MKLSILTADGTRRHQMSPRNWITPTGDAGAYPCEPGFVPVLYSESHDSLPVAEPAPVVPAEVTRWQFRKALLSRGVLPSQIASALAAISDPVARESAQTDWECAEHVERGNPLVASLAPAFGLSADDVDALFIHAASI